MKKFLCLLLIIAMVAVPMVACGPKDDGPEKPLETSANRPGSEGIDKPNLPDKKFNGADFNILTEKAEKWGYYPLDIDEIDENDAYANAIHNRNALVEDRLDINIVGSEQPGAPDVTKLFQNDIQAQSFAYHAVFNTVQEMFTVVAAGLCMPFDELTYVNLDNNYWNHDCTEQLTLGGRSYINSGDIMISDKEVIWAMYFIKSRIKEQKLESPYDLVNNNEWTWDKMMEMADSVDEDVNGDDTMTINSSDIFGLCTHWENYAASWESAGLKAVEFGEDGSPYLAWGEEEFYNVHSDIVDLMTNKEVVSASDIDWISSAITKNKTLFGTEVMAFVRTYRESENEFGIVPYPKYNSNVPRFNSYVARNSAGVSVGYGHPEAEYISIVLETMAWLGKSDLTPEYYDKQLKGRYASDSESASMLDIIFEYRCYDIGVFVDKYGAAGTVLSQADTSISSIWAKQGGALQNDLDKLVSKLLNQ